MEYGAHISKQLVNDIYEATPKLRAAILFFLKRIPDKLNRISLCKHLYYADGHYFQKRGKAICELPYLHIEGSPQPQFFNEICMKMISKGELEVVPSVATEVRDGKPLIVLKGLVFRGIAEPPAVFSRDEQKVLNSVAATLAGDLSLETRYFPHLYQHYAGTGLFEVIPHMHFPEGRRPHLSWKAWARKVFRLMWQ